MTFNKKFCIGIDLGTTNCALAYSGSGDESTNKTLKPKALAIPQIVAPGELGNLPLLPSFLYLPSEVEFADKALDLPWEKDAAKGQGDAATRGCTGLFARNHGGATPSRLLSSAKSWLSHSGVDRRAAILPWGASEEVPRLSPVAASSRYLGHLRAAWNLQHAEAPLEEQNVVLTVPASFDAVARELTVDAAKEAGFPESLRLLEEPQAAMYAWLAARGSKWREELSVGDVVLVIDIGGGTTDFSLIEVQEREGEVVLERIAVGDHILLGGDNMDLALAHSVRAQLAEDSKEIDDWQMRALTHACRTAKETLLGTANGADSDSDVQPLVIPGRSSKLIGGSIRSELSRETVEQVVLDGFFPKVELDAKPQQPRRVGLRSAGLPYAQDAGITRYLAAFLSRAQSGAGSGTGTDSKAADVEIVLPSAILFNGGVTHSPLLKERIREVLQSWTQAAGKPDPRLLSGTDVDLAVATGAAYYANAREHGGLRIRSSTAMAYYIGFERAELAVPGVAPSIDAVCIAPFGMEEGSDLAFDQVFGLVLGEVVSFRFFSSATRSQDQVGTRLGRREIETLSELSPIETSLDGEAGTIVQVRLHAAITEVGMLELAAVELGSERRWKLSFDVRME